MAQGVEVSFFDGDSAPLGPLCPPGSPGGEVVIFEVFSGAVSGEQLLLRFRESGGTASAATGADGYGTYLEDGSWASCVNGAEGWCTPQCIAFEISANVVARMDVFRSATEVEATAQIHDARFGFPSAELLVHELEDPDCGQGAPNIDL